MDAIQFHVPCKKITLIDALNRCAAATGSVSYAMASASADYNGHALSLYWNDYRGYYVCDYHWGERVVITRSADFAQALAASKREFARQGRGASLRISCRPQDAEIARADGDLIEGKEAETAYMDAPEADHWRFKLVGTAARYNRQNALLKAASQDEFYDLCFGRVKSA